MDTEISSNILRDLYLKQFNLQQFMKEKRGLQAPPALDATEITHDHVLAAIYFSSCVNLEWMELNEAYGAYVDQDQLLKSGSGSVDATESARKEALMELIDVFHFVLSVFIFLGLKIEYVGKLYHYRLGGFETLQECVGETALAISKVLSRTPYKTWKDQKNTRELSIEYEEFLFSQLSVVYNNLMDFAIEQLDSCYTEFVELYIEKNALNFQRQEDKTLGYIH